MSKKIKFDPLRIVNHNFQGSHFCLVKDFLPKPAVNYLEFFAGYHPVSLNYSVLI